MYRASLVFGLAIAAIVISPLRQARGQQPSTQSPAKATQEPSKATTNDSASQPQSEPESQPSGKDREQKLAAYLSGAIFAGKFTIDGREDKSPKMEEYTISKCEKLEAPDMYRMTARIKYGEIDSEVPLDIKILWSGNTPVITLDSFWIPGMGTFGARVLIHSGRYAGTWQHDEVGGHMFGLIKK